MTLRFALIALLSLAWMSTPALALGPWHVELPADGRLAQVLSGAEAVVAARIVVVGERPAAGDGPVALEAVVDRTVKGPVGAGERVRFEESGWCGPTYRVGDERILFLSRSDGGSDGARWQSLCPVTGKLDCFVDPREAGSLSADSLAGYLDLLARARSAPPRMEAALAAGAVLAVEVTLANPGTEPLWLDPARVRALLATSGIMHPGTFELPGGTPGWTMIPPGGKVAGAARFPGVGADGRGAVLTLLNDAVLYPRRCWTGTLRSGTLGP